MFTSISTATKAGFPNWSMSSWSHSMSRPRQSGSFVHAASDIEAYRRMLARVMGLGCASVRVQARCISSQRHIKTLPSTSPALATRESPVVVDVGETCSLARSAA